jgi:hypothetical protein
LLNFNRFHAEELAFELELHYDAGGDRGGPLPVFERKSGGRSPEQAYETSRLDWRYG